MQSRFVTIRRLDFTRFGNIDAWLRSDVFGLKHARSILAEEAIERAKALQLSDDPDPDEVLAIDRRLAGLLRDDDSFWPRWRYFAEQCVGREV